MKRKIVASFLVSSCAFAAPQLDIGYGVVDFKNSKQKADGTKSYLRLSETLKSGALSLYYETSKTDTHQPPMQRDLKVDKYNVRYSHSLSKALTLNMGYSYMEDNIAPTDGGKVYALGFALKQFSFTQYLSDYRDFNVYQSDVAYKMRFTPSKEWQLSALVEGKYLKLDNKASNFFSQYAKDDYFLLGLKASAHYKSYLLRMGSYIGKRTFGVFHEGEKIQHHAMEFKETYFLGLSKRVNNLKIGLKYVYQVAKELPLDNDDVQVDFYALTLGYRF